MPEKSRYDLIEELASAIDALPENSEKRIALEAQYEALRAEIVGSNQSKFGMEYTDKPHVTEPPISPEQILADVVDAQERIADSISPVVSKIDGRPTEELVGMARNKRKELNPDNTGEFLQALIADLQKAQEVKHEFVTAHADIFTQKKDVIDTDVRIAERLLRGAIAEAIENDEIKLDKHRVNEQGQELSSYELPSWLPVGIDIQNDSEVVIPDMDKLMQMVRMMQLWEVVSIDTTKLERYLARQENDRAGKNTSKFADPFQLPAIVLNKFKPTIGKEVNWVPDTE
jgi:hypothetical protein